MRRAPRPNGAGEEARDRSRAGPALPDARRSPQRRLDVLHAMRRGVAIEVERPLPRALTTAEELARGLRQRLDHVGVDSAMPGDELARAPPSPTLVDEAIDRLDAEAAHLGEATLATNDTKRVLLPVEDVRERILHGPRITRRRAADRTLPVSRCEPRDDPVEARELALRLVDDFLARVCHGPRRILPYGDGHALPEGREDLGNDGHPSRGKRLNVRGVVGTCQSSGRMSVG